MVHRLPPAEVVVHPSDENHLHEFYLMCADIEALAMEMKEHHIACGPVERQGWGSLIRLTLPAGGKLGIYQPRHARPTAVSANKGAQKPAERSTKKSVGRSAQVKSRKKAKRS